MIAEPARHAFARPMLDAFRLEHLGPCGNSLGGAGTERCRRADQGKRGDTLCPAGGECARDSAADFGADQVKALDAEVVHQPDVIVDDDIKRPLEVPLHRRRAAETAHVRAHHAVTARELRHPAVPSLSALAIAVQQQDGFGLRPRVGEVVDLVMHFKAG